MKKVKENKLTRNFATIFIVILMVGSVLGYMFGRNPEDNFQYKDYKFWRKDNKYVLNINKKEFKFDYFPSDVENIEVDSGVLDKFSNKVEIESTYDKDDKGKVEISVAQYDLERYFDIVGIYFVKGLTTENEFNMSIIKCSDATSKVPVIYFRDSNQTKVFLEGNCIIAEAKSEPDFIRIKDRLIYGLLGVIKNE